MHRQTLRGGQHSLMEKTRDKNSVSGSAVEDYVTSALKAMKTAANRAAWSSYPWFGR
jgi:hypothetical protein